MANSSSSTSREGQDLEVLEPQEPRRRRGRNSFLRIERKAEFLETAFGPLSLLPDPKLSPKRMASRSPLRRTKTR
ncbi:hypothetical protein GCM10023165_27520 [Variovorax defluvii]|uniref:Uncharacterized protein n=1 Tax=Variovorax defluvii TaxID=913761 RepID=A0ABP8HTY9_9BURK